MPDGVAAPVASLDAKDTAHSADGDNVEFLGDHKYRIEKKLGQRVVWGRLQWCGTLWREPHTCGYQEPRTYENPQLRDEYRTYQIITDHGKSQVDGIPRIHGFGRIRLQNALAIDLLGSPLEGFFYRTQAEVYTQEGGHVSQAYGVVERVHAKGIVHRELKPENFLLGRPETLAANEVHLIDFGMVRRYKDPQIQVHIPYREGKSLLGTARCMSINIHLGREQSRRDDLEVLCYVWLYFLRGRLPWQGIKAPEDEKDDRIREKKQETTIEDLCTGCPVQFAECLRYVRGLDFDEKPDYGYLQDRLSQVLEKAWEVDDGKFDWVNFEEERSRLEIRPPSRSDSVAATGKRQRAASVPDQGEVRGRKLPALLRNIAEEEAPEDCRLG